MVRTNTHDSTTTDRDERRWDRWGRITLVIGVVLLAWPVLSTLATYRYPTDGWSSTAVESFSIGGPPAHYRAAHDPAHAFAGQ